MIVVTWVLVIAIIVGIVVNGVNTSHMIRARRRRDPG
jgi:hypothetical protein